MATGASTCDLAIILIDASRIVGKGLKSQTRRHAAIANEVALEIGRAMESSFDCVS